MSLAVEYTWKNEFPEIRISVICYIKTGLRVNDLLGGKSVVPGEREQI